MSLRVFCGLKIWHLTESLRTSCMQRLSLTPSQMSFVFQEGVRDLDKQNEHYIKDEKHRPGVLNSLLFMGNV